MKIYAITKGEYSDYHICALTIDKAKAERLAKIYSDSWRKASISTFDDGEYNDEVLGFYLVWTGFDDASFQGIFNQKTHREEIKDLGGGSYQVYVSAEDEDHAKKKAYDMLAKYKAEQAGL